MKIYLIFDGHDFYKAVKGELEKVQKFVDSLNRKYPQCNYQWYEEELIQL